MVRSDKFVIRSNVRVVRTSSCFIVLLVAITRPRIYLRPSELHPPGAGSPPGDRGGDGAGRLNLNHSLPSGCDENYSAVEIGTSNFDTLIQAASPEETGLSVDAMQVYIDQLPELPCWDRLNRAVVGSSADVPDGGRMLVYFVDPTDIEKHGLPSWLKGSNSVDVPHPIATNFLRKRGLIHLMQNRSVEVISVGRILDERGICRPRKFKVDVEGLDGNLLVGFSQWVERWNGTCHADEVQGEFNELSRGIGPEMTDAALLRVGYRKVLPWEGWDRKWRYQP